MKFLSLRVRGFGVFVAERIFRFGELEGPLTAITGDNGAGKTSLLELMLAAIYRECPTRGALIDLAVARDAELELEVEHAGARFVLLQKVDSHTRKSQTLIRKDGALVLEETKSSLADAWVEKNFPPLSVVLVTTFASQKSRGLVGYTKGERKARFLPLIGITGIEERAVKARARSDAVRGTVAWLTASIDTLEAQAAKLRPGAGELIPLAAGMVSVNINLTAARAEFASAEVEHTEARIENAALEGAERERRRLEIAASTARDQAQATTKRLDDARIRRAELGPKLGPALERGPVLRLEIAALNRQVDRATSDMTAAYQLAATCDARITEVNRERAGVYKHVVATEDVDAAVIAEPNKYLKREALQLSLNQIKERHAKLRGEQLAGAGQRIWDLRVGLEAIKLLQAVATARSTAEATLKHDDDQVARVITHGDEVARVLTDLGDCERQHHEANTDWERVRARAAMAPARELSLRALAAHDNELVALAAQRSEHRANALEHTRRRDELNEKARELDLELAEIVKLERTQPAYDRALADIAALEPVQADQVARAAALQAELDKLPPPVPLRALPDVEALRRKVGTLEHMRSTTAAGVARAEQAAEQLAALNGQLAEHLKQRAAAELELSDWVVLARTLGKDALQASLIDAAVPEVVGITNDLLHAAFGARFTLDIRTQASDARGKKLLEVFDIIVFDGKSGREADIETYSGGEEGIVTEGLALGLTTIACRRLGLRSPTLVRDESGAPLSAKKGPQWIDMLRRAAELIGADRVLFVSHTEALWKMANSRIDLDAPSPAALASSSAAA